MGPWGAWTLFRVGGVPVRIHFTWIFIAVYLTALFTSQFRRLAAAADVIDARLSLPPWMWGGLLTLALFACVLLHELAHIAVARRQGAKVRSVTLMMLGGVSEIGELPGDRSEAWMAVVGPLSSLALAAASYGLFHLFASSAADLRFGLYYLTQVNLVIGVFNLMPAFPLDGGRILRSALVPRLGRLRATRVAALVGKLLAGALVAFGILRGDWWLLLIGLFIFLGGEAESRALEMRAALTGLTVGDVFSPRLAAVGPDATLADAARAMMDARTGVCLVLAGGAPLGVASASTLALIPVRERSARAIGSVMTRALLVGRDEEIPALLRRLDEDRLDAAVVIDHERVAGTVSREDIARAVQLRELSAHAPPSGVTS